MKIVKYLWTALLTLSLVLGLLDKRIVSKNFEVFSQISFMVVLQNIIVVAVVMLIAAGLIKTNKIFKFSIVSLFSWLKRKFIDSDSENNDDKISGNFNLIPVQIKYFGLLFVIILAFNLPQFAGIEEHWFREGLLSWKSALIMSLALGMVHCLVGVPIGAGVAISFAGLWFSYQYFNGGVELSTVHHTTYNLVAISLLFFVLLVAHIDELRKKFLTRE